MKAKVFKIGSKGKESRAIIIPKAVCDILNIEEGDYIEVGIDLATERITLVKLK